jgi:hypothetical protein
MKVTLWKELNDSSSEMISGGATVGEANQYNKDVKPDGITLNEWLKSFGYKNYGQYVSDTLVPYIKAGGSVP